MLEIMLFQEIIHFQVQVRLQEQLISKALQSNGKQLQLSKGADIASASALPLLTDGNFFDVTGTTTI